MDKPAKISTGSICILSGIGWLLGVLFFVLNVARRWELWQAWAFH